MQARAHDSALHKASLFGPPYSIFVRARGLAIAMPSGSGVYIWWKKRAAREAHSAKKSLTAKIDA
ncbi:hypothetical protein IY145_16825 [Methylosinus sp. H3A]|uniref:hypothetical protein n=1 Tax=Methylosinus sp. H3A TaxID=2785786 RepID=UPI0018C30631|nr:hypothetical protein [Methylosinus sp. H3A]MBG0811036.1 hypothetical protein [Methylosinus sp. H3A]